MPKVIHCEIWIEDGQKQATIARNSRPFAEELSEHDNGRRILELTAEKLPPQPKKGHKD